MTIVQDSLEEMIAKIGPYKLGFDGELKKGIWQASKDITSELKENKALKKNIFLKLIFREALLNAEIHGNDKDRNKPIFGKLYFGEHYVIAQITDSGNGFDYEKVNKEKNYIYEGYGFKHYRSDIVYVSFENGGRTVNIRGLLRKESEQ